MLSKPGGMTYGWMNYFRLDQSESTIVADLSFRDVDILAKVIEMEPELRGLRLQLHAAVRTYQSLPRQEYEAF